MALTLSVEEIVEQSKSPLLGIASGWKRVRLGDIATIQNGAPFKSELFNKEGKGMPVIRIRDVGNAGTDTYYSGEYDPAYVVRDGDLLIGMDGDFNCARWKGPDALLNQRVCRILPKTDKYEPRLMDHALPGYLKAINEVTSSVTVKHLSSKTIADIPLPLPPLPQQRRIVEAIEVQLGRLDAAVARLQGAKARLERYKQAVLKAAVEGRLTEEWREKNPDVEHADTLVSRLKEMRRDEWERQKMAGERRSLIQNETAEQQEPLDIELPDTWTWATPEEIASPEPYAIGIGPFGSNLKVSDYTSEGVPLIFVRHITSENFDLDLKFTSERKYKELIAHVAKPLDVLVAKMGDPPGDATIYPEDRLPGVMTADCIKLRVWAPHISREYVMHCIRSYVVKQQLGLITIGVAQKKISTGRFKTLLFPMPPTREQFVIAEMIAERLDRCKTTEDLVDAQLQQAVRLRQAVLKRAFEGRLG